MSREKNIFEKFPKKWPKGAFGKPVRGERGNHDLPSGAKGGEKMDLDRHEMSLPMLSVRSASSRTASCP